MLFVIIFVFVSLIQSKSEVRLNIDFISGDSPEGTKAVITAIDKDKIREKEVTDNLKRSNSKDENSKEREKSFERKPSLAKSSKGSSRDQSKERKSASSSDGEKSSKRSSISDEEKVSNKQLKSHINWDKTFFLIELKETRKYKWRYTFGHVNLHHYLVGLLAF